MPVSRLLFVLCCAVAAAVARAADLPPAFVEALKRAAIPLDHVAVVVQALDEDAPRLSHQAEAALNPASVMKLVTSFAALQQLGPNYTWVTEIWTDGVLKDGVLDGDLIVRGNGDPSLTLERMWLLQRELRARGVRAIQGGLVLDASHFDLPEVDPGAFDGEPFAPYNAPAGALAANFNAVVLRLKPDPAGVTIVPDVALPGVTLTSRLALTDASECSGWRGVLTPRFGDAANTELVVEGRYPRACGEQAWPLALFPPAATFDVLFRGLWAESGGTLAGPSRPGVAPDMPPLLRSASKPLADALRRLNKYSNNLMAKNLFLTLGAEAYGGPATPDKGARAVRETLVRQGVDTDKLVLENGSGLSRIERISANALNQLLRAAWRSPLFSEFESALPIVAVDGTLRRRFNGSAATGNAHLKSGTLRDVSALAGYVFTAAGRRVAFVVLVNHPHARRADAAQQALLEWVWADGLNGGSVR